MIDISRPLPTKIDERIKAKDKRRKEKQREKIDNEDKLNEEGNEKKGKYGTKVKENGQVKFYGYGRRLWQFCLTDGYQKCLAIEYEPLNWLKKPIIGQKILLIGPFDVYMGTIMVKNSNLQLLTTNVPSITLNDIDFNEILEEYDVELEMEALGNQDDTWKF